MTLSAATTPGQSGPKMDGNKALPPLQRCSLCIQQLQPTRSQDTRGGGVVLPICRDAVGEFCSPCQLGSQILLSNHIYPNPPLGQDMTQGQFLSGVYQVWIQSFPSPRLVALPSRSYYLPIAGGRIIGFIPFQRVLVLCEMQSVSSRIWTRVAVSISYDDNHYTTGTSKYYYVTLKIQFRYTGKEF